MLKRPKLEPSRSLKRPPTVEGPEEPQVALSMLALIQLPKGGCKRTLAIEEGGA